MSGYRAIITAILGKKGQPAEIRVVEIKPEARVLGMNEVIMSNVRSGLPLRYGISPPKEQENDQIGPSV